MPDVRVPWLSAIWDELGSPGYAFLMYRDDEGVWHDKSIGSKRWMASDFRIPNEGETVYFCPYLFKGPNRRRELARPTVWLHADLDEVDPALDPLPNVAWETSPGRYQCLWLLETPISVKSHRALNQKLNYYVKADKGGWSITKALRLPGTMNLKYEEPFEVRLLWDDRSQPHRASELWERVRGVPTPGDSVSIPELVLPEGMTKSAVISKHRKKLPPRALKLLEATEADGDRSAVIWKLEKLMLEAGVPAEEVLVAVRDTPWNKYKGQRRELRQLWTEVQKASATLQLRSASSPPKSRSKKPGQQRSWAQPANDFIWQNLPEPGWLVEGIWSSSAHGLIAGEEKTYKSVIAMDLAISVATGTPFLDRFEVPRQGGVLMIQEENKPAMVQDRFRKILHSRGLLGRAAADREGLTLEPTADVPIWVKNQEGFDLQDEENLEGLEVFLDEQRPALAIFDPLYLVAVGADENRAQEMKPILQKLLSFKVKYGTGMLLIHHYKKLNPEHPISGSQRMSGTGALGRWFESACFVESTDDPFVVRLVPQHREAPPTGSIELEFHMGDFGELDYHVTVDHRKDDRARVRELITQFGTIPLQRLSEVLDKDKRTIKNMVEKMGFVVELGEPTGDRGRPPLIVRNG